MQVDVEELYAALEAQGSKPPPLRPGSSPSTAPAPVVIPAAAGIPEEASSGLGPKHYVLIALIAVAASVAAWGLSQVVFSDPEPEPEGTMELGPIELSE